MIYCKSNNNKDKSTLFTYSNRQYLHIHKFQNNKENRMDHFKLHSEYNPQETSLRLSKNWSIIIVLLIVVGISMVTFGSIVCNKLRQPQNYIEALDSDSIEGIHLKRYLFTCQNISLDNEFHIKKFWNFPMKM